MAEERTMQAGGIRRADGVWIAGVLLAFAPALFAMARTWLAHDYYSHGFLVPVVSLWVFFDRRRRLPPPGMHPAGIAVIAVAALVFAGGLLAASATWQGLAFVGALAGLVLRIWGGEGLRRLGFPLAFLLFMVPVPPAILSPLIVSLQLLVSVVAVDLLQAAGLSVLREGNVMLLPGGDRLFVDEACSGITSIVTLLPLGVVLAWFTERTALRRGLLIAAVIPIAMLGNLLRVLATVAGADRFGADAVTSGAVHDAAGLLTFVLACLLLIGFGALLRLSAGGPRRSRAA